jgi:hypothetical protein
MHTILKTILIPLTLTVCSTAQTEQVRSNTLSPRNTDFAVDSLYGSSSGTSQATNHNRFAPQNDVRPNRLRIGGQFYFEDTDTFDQQVTSLDLNMGWRIGGYFEIGPEVSLYRSKYTTEDPYAPSVTTTLNQLQLGPQFRVYFLSPSVSRWQPWVKLGLGIGVQDDGESEGFTYTSFGPGVSCFMTPSFAFEASLLWERHDWSDDAYVTNHSTRFMIGISTFF